MEWYQNELDSKGYIIRILDTMKTPSQVGFIIIATEEHCPPPYDYYIWDCYVEPEYRRRYIMWDAMQSFIKEHGGSYCMFLIDINVPAQSFWHKLFNSLGYVEHTEKIQEIVEMEDKKTHFHGFIKTN
jgi:predicted acetyltransferase